MKRLLLLKILIVLAVALPAFTLAVSAQFGLPPNMTPEQRNAYLAKIHAASEADWRRTMALLNRGMPDLPEMKDDPARPQGLVQKPGSTYNWYDAIGQTYLRSFWGTWTNYDESKANNYTLPDPLVLKNGQPVKDAATWWKQRRPEILADYENEIYGHIPAHTPKVTFEVTSTDNHALNGKAIRKTIVGHIDNLAYPADTPSIIITLYIPTAAKGPVPLMVTVGGFLEGFPGMKRDSTPTALDMVIARGWAIGTVNTSAIQADNGAGLTEGIIGLVNQGKPRQLSDWGVLAAWSWGLSRALDYFETDKAINKKQIGIEGHSRWGKTALLAAALDPRWSIVYASCSGCMGASLEKRNYAENIGNVAASGEYHWMAGNFLKYGNDWAGMPVDAHELIALVAPRPVFITGGTQDTWADPKGEFLACVAAGPVYKLLGKKDMGTAVMPAPDHGLMEGEIAFRLHVGGHTDLLDWPVFIEFAARQWKLPSVK
ncbi:MAG TPA: hypothetical protein VGM41_18930 [Chitinophagaceae bacterium]|jgi:hypothetical protein